MRTGILKCPSCGGQRECEMVGGEPPRSNGKVYIRLYRCLKCGKTIEREVGGWRKPMSARPRVAPRQERGAGKRCPYEGRCDDQIHKPVFGRVIVHCGKPSAPCPFEKSKLGP